MPIKNLILDLGGVIFDIDYEYTIRAFADVGMDDSGQVYSQKGQLPVFDLFEKGLITPNEFCDELRNLCHKDTDNETIVRCWNALLIGIPQENIDTLYRLKEKYRLFLLSNTNEIHEIAFKQNIVDQHGRYFFDEVFEKVYLSHHIHMRKPDREIFDFVINDNNLNREECLFIDDSIQHIHGANAAGIEARLLVKGERLAKIIS
ncbi:MAG: HAD family phosphatase [Bacteroidetes bacterium]|nr:HAD family phosphatase [Bacteroidota bacterium]